MDRPPVIIIGASAAGISAAKEIRNIAKDVGITLISDETASPYYRPFLTEYIRNKSVSEKPNFYLNPDDWYRKNNVTLRLGEKVLAVDPGEKTVTTAEDQTLFYDRLILANGSVPFVPLADSLRKKNVFAIRTCQDAVRVHEYAYSVKNAVVIGGGLLGLEAAYSLAERGIAVTVIELGTRILSVQLDAEGSRILERMIASHNVKLILGRSVGAIEGGETAGAAVLNNGEKLQAGMIIFSIGVRPNSGLAQSCGIAVNRAVVVNERMETSAPHVYACGDVAEFNGRNVCLWMPAMKQGKVAGANAAGGKSAYADERYPAVLNSFGTHVYSIGDIPKDGDSGGLRDFTAMDREKNNYRKLYFRNDRLAGFILIGDIREAQKLSQALKNGLAYGEVVRE